MDWWTWVLIAGCLAVVLFGLVLGAALRSADRRERRGDGDGPEDPESQPD